MNRIIVSFDKSQEDIPTLIVGEEPLFSLNPTMKIINVITGDRAVEIWDELNNAYSKSQGN